MTIFLFDVDGTLATSGQVISKEMVNVLSSIQNITLGIVGGGSYSKICWQLGDAIGMFDYIFAECGAIVYHKGSLISEKNMLDYCDRDILNLIIRTAMSEISSMPIIYHGHQIDFRKGLVYISPVGMQATNYERNIFLELDRKLALKEKLLEKLEKVNNNHFEITLGGTIGIAVHPIGWNKSQVVEYFSTTSENIYYFGDKTEPNGNDYPLYIHPRIKGISVTDYHDTIEKLRNLMGDKKSFE